MRSKLASIVSPRSRNAFCSDPGPEFSVGPEFSIGPEFSVGPGALPMGCKLLSELLTDAPGVGVWDDGPRRLPAPAAGGPDEEEMSRVAGGSALLCCLDFFPKRKDMMDGAQSCIRPADNGCGYPATCGAGSGC
jgi:hypothetical protein